MEGWSVHDDYLKINLVNILFLHKEYLEDQKTSGYMPEAQMVTTTTRQHSSPINSMVESIYPPFYLLNGNIQSTLLTPIQVREILDTYVRNHERENLFPYQNLQVAHASSYSSYMNQLPDLEERNAFLVGYSIVHERYPDTFRELHNNLRILNEYFLSNNFFDKTILERMLENLIRIIQDYNLPDPDVVAAAGLFTREPVNQEPDFPWMVDINFFKSILQTISTYTDPMITQHSTPAYRILVRIGREIAKIELRIKLTPGGFDSIFMPARMQRAGIDSTFSSASGLLREHMIRHKEIMTWRKEEMITHQFRPKLDSINENLKYILEICQKLNDLREAEGVEPLNPYSALRRDARPTLDFLMGAPEDPLVERSFQNSQRFYRQNVLDDPVLDEPMAEPMAEPQPMEIGGGMKRYKIKGNKKRSKKSKRSKKGKRSKKSKKSKRK